MTTINHCNGVVNIEEHRYQSLIIGIIPSLVVEIQSKGIKIDTVDDIREYIRVVKSLPIVGCDLHIINKLYVDEPRLEHMFSMLM